ncbi:MAG: DUF554 domain-containing protein [Candidatus Sumerlaeota bacterium]|nr:DUF554 domain-containing protein [Candidatus Sumerlaeota bacterium]
MPFLGVIVNVLTVLCGSLLGLTIVHRISENVRTVILRAIGLGTLVLGIDLAHKTQNLILPMGSLLLGGILGTLWNVEGRLNGLAERLRQAVRSDSAHFVQGFVFSSLLFCVGPMTLVGSLQDGVGDSNLLLTKALMDGFSSIALASSMGAGVLFSTITIVLLQGSLAAVGWFMHDLGATRVFAEVSATGGLMILAIGLDLLDIKRLPVANFLPALAVAVPLAMIAGWLGG